MAQKVKKAGTVVFSVKTAIKENKHHFFRGDNYLKQDPSLILVTTEKMLP